MRCGRTVEGKMLDGKLEYSEEMAGDQAFTCSSSLNIIINDEVTTTISSKKKKSKNNKRRFSDEQIKSLESMFESETRLEPRKKLQVARELGLQPRQVAIWFQNKRARWKSKQLERDYSILQANYNALASKFEALKKEKQALLIQLQKLNESVKKPKLEEGGQLATEMNNRNIGIDEGAVKYCESEGQVSLSMERSEHALGVLSDDDSAIKTEHYLGLEEDQANNLVSMVEAGDDGCLTSPEDWRSFESDGLFDEPSSSAYQWWDFWS